MAVMFRLNQADLFFIQLLVTCQGFAGDHRNRLVSWGDSVTLICNTTMTNATQITWTNGRHLYSYSVLYNQTLSNFTHRMTIDPHFPSTLNISNAQHEDAGLYRCTVASAKGTVCIEWNLTVSEKPEERRPLLSFLYIPTSVIGLLLCGTVAAVCICRKLRARTPNQNPVQDQVHLESADEVVVPQPQGSSARRTDNKHNYMERLNSIYGINRTDEPLK